jgi:hypothetical protein
MRTSSYLLSSSRMAMGLTATAIAIAVILLASNFTTIDAQQQFNQPGEIENGTTEATGTTTTTFQSTNDSFSIEVPQGWIIQDIDNTGSTLLEERTQGYGMLAQLCPEEQGAAAAASTASGSNTNTISSINASRCQGAQEVIHIIRYPDLDTTTNNNMTTTTADNILAYHLQKLQEVGYRSIQIVNSTDVTSNLRNPETNETIMTVPGRLVEMTYSTNSTPDEIKRGHFILTATNGTVPNVGTTKGYSVFYEGNSTTTTPAEITTAAASLPLPAAVAFDSFELIAAPEVAQAAETDDDNGGDDDDNGGDDDDNGGDDDDNGGDDDGNGDDGDDNGGDDDGDDNGGDDDGDDNGGDDDGDDNGGDDEGEGGGGGEGNPNEFDDCIVPPGMDPGDVGC